MILNDICFKISKKLWKDLPCKNFFCKEPKPSAVIIFRFILILSFKFIGYIMTDALNRKIELIDKAIYFFSILFLCTLTNTIFLNQFGYFVPLLLILYRFYLTKENPFKKTGLEYALLFYMAAEIISTILSLDKFDSLDSLRKRFLLIPTLYTFLFAAKEFERTKKFVMIYLGAALITMLVYIGLSYNYYINSFYQIYESGPGTFQYPITTSELMSFSLVLLAAFLIHENLSLKKRLFVFLCFLVNLIALLATYKRTGWMGAAAGILFMIILSRKWLILTPVVILVIAASFIEKNVSNVFIYDYQLSSVSKSSQFKTDGRATDILPARNEFYLSDYENGLVRYHGNNPVDKIDLGTPVMELLKWRGNFYLARLVDTRFIQLEKDSTNKFKKGSEFLSPGFTEDWCIANKFLYMMDSDSGITIFRNPLNPKDKFRFLTDAETENQKIFVDSTYLVLFSKSCQLTVYSLKNSLPDKIYLKKNFNDRSKLVFYKDGKIIVDEKDGLNLYSIQSGQLTLLDADKNSKGIFSILKAENNLLAVTTKGDLTELSDPSTNKLSSKPITNLGFVPKSINYSDGKLYLTLVKRSRLLSSFDPYVPSNFTRLALWRAGWNIFKDHPFFGVGDMDLAQLYKQYKRDYDKEIQGHMHNNFVHILVTLGIFGFCAVMFLFYKIFRLHLKNYSSLKNEPFSGSYALGAAGMFVSFIVSGLTEWNFGDHEIITVVWFSLGFSIALYYYHKERI